MTGSMLIFLSPLQTLLLSFTIVELGKTRIRLDVVECMQLLDISPFSAFVSKMDGSCLLSLVWRLN